MAKIGQKQAETRQREPKIVFLDHQQVPVLGQKKVAQLRSVLPPLTVRKCENFVTLYFIARGLKNAFFIPFTPFFYACP